MIKLINGFKSLSIIGLEKNVGKTTTLNYIIEKTKGILTLGLTSIGRDGETIDRVTNTEKPRIYVYKGTVIATARQCLSNVDVTKEILWKSNIFTPLGEIIIIRALGDGYIDLAGPSITKELEHIRESIMEWNTDMLIIDGALSRKSLASPSVTEATILATGAAVAKSINEVVQKTAHTYKLLSFKAIEDELVYLLEQSSAKAIAIKHANSQYTLFDISIPTSLGAGAEILFHVEKDTTHLFIRGAITESFANALIKNRDGNIPLTLIVEDGTKLFINEDTLRKLSLKKINLCVQREINVIAITINPTSPFGYSFDGALFKKLLEKQIDAPIFNVRELY